MMLRTVALLVFALAAPSASAVASVEFSTGSLVEASQQLDGDGSYLPDPVDALICSLEAQGSPDDGSCIGSTYSPPAAIGPLTVGPATIGPFDVGPLDADRDDVPDALEAPICASAPQAALGTCVAGDFTPARSTIVRLTVTQTDGVALILFVDENADGTAAAGETTAAACAPDASSCALASHGRRARMCASDDALRVKGCLEDSDGDGRLLLQELLACSDPTDPASTGHTSGDPAQCGILPP